MNTIRIAISLFIVLVTGISVAGWFWTATHQTPPQAAASHVVLALGIVAGVVGLIALWRPRGRAPGRRR